MFVLLSKSDGSAMGWRGTEIIPTPSPIGKLQNSPPASEQLLKAEASIVRSGVMLEEPNTASHLQCAFR